MTMEGTTPINAEEHATQLQSAEFHELDNNQTNAVELLDATMEVTTPINAEDHLEENVGETQLRSMKFREVDNNEINAVELPDTAMDGTTSTYADDHLEEHAGVTQIQSAEFGEVDTDNMKAVEMPVLESYHAAPNFGFKKVPVQVTGAWKPFENPLDNYTRGCKWSPDGSCILTCSNDDRLRVFNLPEELLQQEIDWENVKEMLPAFKVHAGGTFYDFAWYPLMSSYDPVTCCFCSASQGNPVHMWDAFTGQLRASYRPYNQVDEVEAPHSVAFDSGGQRLFCGFDKRIRIFDVCIPGRDCTERRTHEKKSGQLGIISCFAFCADDQSYSAAGSFGGTVGLYSEPDGFLEHLLPANSRGVTHVHFSPDGTKLYSGGRKDMEILCWDVRNLDNVLFSLRRTCFTGQRMYFDVSACGRYLMSGNHNGIVTIWDITKEPKVTPLCETSLLEPIQFYKAHEDCVNGVSFHPTMSVMATCSGQRHFPELIETEEELQIFDSKKIQRDNSLRIWWAQDFE